MKLVHSSVPSPCPGFQVRLEEARCFGCCRVSSVDSAKPELSYQITRFILPLTITLQQGQSATEIVMNTYAPSIGKEAE